MKLKAVQINEFRSVRDSKPFEIGQVTCLVGKNESGKSSLLQALYRLNPIVDEHATYNVTDDYPRTYVTRYKRQLTAGDIEPATVATATFALEPADLEPIAQVFRGVIAKNELTISRGYSNTLDHAMGEAYRDSRRPHFLGGWGLWDVQVGFHRRCVSARSGW